LIFLFHVFVIEFLLYQVNIFVADIRQTEQRLRMLEEQYGGEQHTSDTGSTFNTGSGIVHGPVISFNQTRSESQ